MKFFNNKIRKAIFAKPYLYFFIFFFLLYLGVNVFVNQIYVTGSILFNNLKLGIPFIFFNLLVGFLVALNINLMIMKFREYKELNKKGSGLTSLGIFAGFLGGACPGCFVGLFPAILGLFGVSASLSVLPLYGLELQAVSAVILVVSAYYLARTPVCKVELD